jgi:hypothetical protein
VVVLQSRERLEKVKRRSNLNSDLKRIKKVGELISGVKINGNPEEVKLKLELHGAVARVKKEGINA